jgi:hypothetical protein
MRVGAIGIGCLFLCGVAGPLAIPQDSPTQTANPPLVLREGTQVYLKFAQEVTAKRAQDGDPVELELARDLKIGNTVVAAAGSRAIGVVVRTNEFHVRPTALQVGRTKVLLRGILTIPEIGANRINGTQAIIRQDEPDIAVVDADTEIPWPSGQPPLIPAGIKSAAGEPEIPADKIRLPNGTPIRVMLVESISSKTVKAGDSVKFQVLGAVKVDNLVVIADKAPVSATVSEAHAAGMAWHAGGLAMRMDFVTLVNQQKHGVQALTTAKGLPTEAAYNWTMGIIQSQGLLLLALPFAPLQHGKQAVIPKGSVFSVMLDGEVLLDRAEVEANQPAVESKHGNASVTVYYSKFDHTPGVMVWCGVAKVGRVNRGQKFNLSLPPGEYFFRLGTKSLPVILNTEEGGEYFLKISSSADSPGGSSGGLRVVEHDVGELESSDMHPVSPKDAPDLTKLDLGQLQADPSANQHR